MCELLKIQYFCKIIQTFFAVKTVRHQYINVCIIFHILSMPHLKRRNVVLYG